MEEPAGDTVNVVSGESVFVIGGVDVVEAGEGVNITCKVNAAAVWISSGGATCSKGILQARTDKSNIKAAKETFNRWLISQL